MITEIDRAAEILKEKDFISDLDEEIKQIILVAVKNHNKYDIENGISEKAYVMSKIIRDADKLDIMREQGNILTEEIIKLNAEVINCFKEQKLVNNNMVKLESDHIFRLLSFVYDLNFKYSYEFLIKNKIIENKIHLLGLYSSEIDEIEEIKKELLNYIDEKIN